jgi:hypothetical protein
MSSFTARPARGRLTVVLALIILAAVAVILWRGFPRWTASAAEVIDRAVDRVNKTIAPGTVRHVVYDGVASDPRGTQRFTDEVWITPGTDHILVMQPARRALPGTTLLDPIGPLLIDETAVWSVDEAGRTVTKAPYDAVCSFQASDWLGDAAMIAELANTPGVTVAGTEVINGRATTRLSWSTFTVWLQDDDGQLVRYADSATGTTYEKTIRVDEILDRSAVAADLFTFSQPAGTTLVTTESGCN